ncbi:hypothetical protein [Herbidospora cretacea]|uniref:hypothetical protein n=1 Tax=Herbidospora cretacea TaxID=28444 RepID=UPI001C3F16D9|nr:hypothetical protein [Herbidospora cretacea]
MVALRTVRMPGQVWGLAAPGQSGPLFVTSYRGRDLLGTVLTALDVSGQVLWKREFEGHPGPPRVSSDTGNVWITHRTPGHDVVCEIDASGTVVQTIAPMCERSERLCAFAVLGQRVITAWLRVERGRLALAGRAPRIALHDNDGGIHWSTPTALDKISYPGVVEAGVHTDGEVRPMRSWSPRSIRAHHPTPLMVAGDRVAATFGDDSSGIAVTFFLDTRDGRLIAATPPGPTGHKAILGPGEFLIGSQGYGAFSTSHYNADGTVVRRWPTHTMPLIDSQGSIRGPEFENVTPSRSHFVALEPDGAVRKGLHLPGYYTSHPVLDREGTAVFWRDGRLLAITAELQPRQLLASPDDQRNVMSRTVLLERGQIAFALGDELVLVSDTGLSAMNDGPWPCADGGLHGNPVQAN